MSHKNTLDTQPLDEQVYNSYRVTFASHRQFRITHPAAIHELARKATVKRYNLTDADVKRIVAEQDALRGVIHAK
jgi:hypothetical protein